MIFLFFYGTNKNSLFCFKANFILIGKLEYVLVYFITGFNRLYVFQNKESFTSDIYKA